MHQYLASDWPDIKQAYGLDISLSQIKPIGNGHINDTFVLQTADNRRWILQRINHSVFTKPDAIQNNFDRVSSYLKAQQFTDPILSIRPTANNQSLCEVNGRYWRVMREIADVYTISQIDNIEQAFSAAQVVARFDKALENLSVTDILTTIDGFHDLSLRLKQFNQALANNESNRRQICLAEIDCVIQYAHLADWQRRMITEFKIPQRVTHNDTKITNILLSKNTNQAHALIDWDTIMPGYWLFDFGDMVRSFTPTINEDGDNSALPEIRFDILQATCEGYLSACRDSLSAFEKENLLMGAQIIIFMLGVRFLTDYLNGDVYFKTQYEAHNLHRCRSQFALLSQLDRENKSWQKMLGLVR